MSDRLNDPMLTLHEDTFYEFFRHTGISKSIAISGNYGDSLLNTKDKNLLLADAALCAIKG